MDAQSRQKLDFGVKNLLLIAAVAGALTYATTLQKPSASSQPILGLGIDSQQLSLANPTFASPKPSELASAVDFQTGTLKSDYVNKVYAQAAAKGAVLGAATYNADLVKQFSYISVQSFSNKDPQDNIAFQVYAQQVSALTQNARTDQLISMAQSADIINRQKIFLKNMQALSVPEQLADYHRLLVGYYGLVFLQQSAKSDTQLSTMLSQVRAQLNVIQQGLLTGSNVALPPLPR